jgi:SAM-dependent methyltransferase
VVLSPIARVRARLPLARRSTRTELLDGDSLTLAEIEANLTDLARLNRLPGGSGSSVAAIRHLAGARADVLVVDVGAGGGDIAVAFARRGWTTVAVDRHPIVAQIARQRTAGTPLIEVRPVDAGSLPFADAAFDVAHASLLLHHLAPDEAVAVLREMARVAALGVVVNDLRRGWSAAMLTMVTTAAVARSPVTRHDGAISARRAYTLEELDRLAADAGLRVTWRSTPWLPRVATALVRG